MSAGHLSFDELAELAEGLLAPRQARDAEAHLDSCEECGARASALAATTNALRGLGPVAMPPEVGTRLDRVLARASEAPTGETVVPDLSQVRQRRRMPPPWTLAAAAAVIVVASVSTILATRGGGHHATSETAGSIEAPLVATTPRQPMVTTESGRVYTPSTLPSLAPSLLGGASLGQSPTGAAGTVTGSGGAAPAPLQPHQDAGVAPPAAKAAGRPTAQNPTAQSPYAQAFGPAAAVPAPLRRYADSQKALLACAAFITDTPGAAPVAVDYARWSNPTTHTRRAPALILVFQDVHATDELDVYVVAPSCDDRSLLNYQVVSSPAAATASPTR
ncbi:MAG TPA: hypothetical protein VHB69_03825 [Mycobacteriales bacterium]|nr:hypothetical protein [Mycobacteriales bacterium]